MLITFLLAASPAQAPVLASPPSSAIRRDDLSAVVARGRLLYALDRAAWLGTDPMLKDVPRAQIAGVRGWIVEPDGDAYRVTFYGEADGRALPIYVASYRNGKVGRGRLIPVSERRPFTPDQQRMAGARAPANADKLDRCVAQPFNSAVIPPSSANASVEAYFLTPQTKTNAWPVGRHYLKRIELGGGRSDTRAFSKSCLEIGTAGMPPGARPVALFVNHVVDDRPNEIHVFTALASGIPLIVQTGETRWHVDGRSIRLMPGAPTKRPR